MDGMKLLWGQGGNQGSVPLLHTGPHGSGKHWALATPLYRQNCTLAVVKRHNTVHSLLPLSQVCIEREIWGKEGEEGPLLLRPRRRAEKRTNVSRSTSLAWCAACARSPPRARAPSASASSGPPPSGTKRGASAASQNASGSLHIDTQVDGAVIPYMLFVFQETRKMVQLMMS